MSLRIYGQAIPLAQLRAKLFKCHQQEEETVAAYTLRLRELFASWQEQELNGSAQDERTIRDQLVLGLRAGMLQQELQRQVRRNPSMSFNEVSSEARALEAELRMELACASRVSLPPPRPTSAALCPEEWREIVRAEVRKEMKDHLNIFKESLMETLLAEIKRQLLPQTHPAVQEDANPPTGRRVPESRYTPSPRQHQTFQWDQRGQPICRGCGKSGHSRRRCPERGQLN